MIRRSTRRTLLMQTALAGVAGSFLQGGVQAHARTFRDSPNERVRFACIGVGGYGDSDTTDRHGFWGLCFSGFA
jgi:hypothetical protein